MHFRSRTSPTDLQRARERRAWGVLLGGLCPAMSLAALCLGLSSPRHAPRPGAHVPMSAFLVQAPPETAPATVQTVFHTPALPPVAVDIPMAEAEPALQEPEIIGMEPFEAPCAIEGPALCEVLPPDLPTATKPATPTAPTAPTATASAPAGDITPPAYKANPAPPYPAALKSSRIEGAVRVRIAVDAQGRPTRVDVIGSSGHRELDTCAQDWILRRWLFTPARRGSTPIAGSVTTSVQFTLH